MKKINRILLFAIDFNFFFFNSFNVRESWNLAKAAEYFREVRR